MVIFAGGGVERGDVGIGEDRLLWRSYKVCPRLPTPAQGGLLQDRRNITILARCRAESEIGPHKESESVRIRGGYYVSCLTGQLYQE